MATPELADVLREKLDVGELDDVEFAAETPAMDDKQRKSQTTRFIFKMDGHDFPASLVNLPTVVETHKAMDAPPAAGSSMSGSGAAGGGTGMGGVVGGGAGGTGTGGGGVSASASGSYLKSSDIGQMLVVYPDAAARAADEAKARASARPGTPWEGHYHSGITPPTASVLSRKFNKARQHGDREPPPPSPPAIAAAAIAAHPPPTKWPPPGGPLVVPFPSSEVRRVEDELLEIMNDDLTNESAGGSGGRFEEVHQEIVEFEDWMVDSANQQGIVIEDAERSSLAAQHPEILLTSEEWKQAGGAGNAGDDAVDDDTEGSHGDAVARSSATRGGSGGDRDDPDRREKILDEKQQVTSRLRDMKRAVAELGEGESKKKEKLEREVDRLTKQQGRLVDELSQIDEIMMRKMMGGS